MSAFTDSQRQQWEELTNKTTVKAADKPEAETLDKSETETQPWLAKEPVEKRYEYLSVRCEFKGYGYTQEFEYIYINGKKPAPWKTLPEMLKALGENGWSLATHTTVSDHYSYKGTSSGGGATQHFNFGRPLL